MKRFQSLNTDKVCEDSMEASTDQMTSRQRGQLLEGKNSEGEPIGRYRSKAYATKKHAMNPVPGYGVPDLYNTGQFSKGIYSEVRGSKVIVDSTDEKTEALAKKYGEVIFGLSPATRREFINLDLRPAFMKIIRQTLKL